MIELLLRLLLVCRLFFVIGLASPVSYEITTAAVYEQESRKILKWSTFHRY